MTDQGSRPRRAVVLVTGMSGAGKSTALVELARRGHGVLDTDEPGWIVEVDTVHGPEPVWDLDRIRARVEQHLDGWLFVAGCVANQAAMYDRFDAVVLLSAPVDVLLCRVAGRTNPFGSTANDRAKIVDDLTTYEPPLRAGTDQEISTTTSVANNVARLENAWWVSGTANGRTAGRRAHEPRVAALGA